MHGRNLGVNPDDLMETPELEQEAKQEILENKDVSSSGSSSTSFMVALVRYKNTSIIVFKKCNIFLVICISGL